MKQKIFVRCDDRLVHGQILYRWAEELKFNHLIVIDDSASSDLIERNIITMSAPKKCDLHIISTKELEFIEHQSGIILILFSSLEVAEKMFRAGISMEQLNLGRLSADVGKKQLVKGIFLSKAEIKILAFLVDNHVRVYSQMSPDDNIIELNVLIVEEGKLL